MTIYEQLIEYCDCVDTDRRDIEEAITILSQMSCWNGSVRDKNICDTFEVGTRREVIDLPKCLDKCGVITFLPFYTPFEPGSFVFKVAHISGINETIYTLTDDSYAYHETTGTFAIDVSQVLPNCVCSCNNRCGCDSEFHLIVDYEAGYDLLPDCMLPVLCNMLTVIHAKNDCECDTCAPCNTSNNSTSVDPITGKVTTSIQTIKYASGDIATVQLETDLARLVVDNYKRELSYISLCDSFNYLWGTVV